MNSIERKQGKYYKEGTFDRTEVKHGRGNGYYPKQYDRYDHHYQDPCRPDPCYDPCYDGMGDWLKLIVLFLVVWGLLWLAIWILKAPCTLRQDGQVDVFKMAAFSFVLALIVVLFIWACRA